MSILEKLSSQIGAGCSEPNREVSKMCLQTPELLDELAHGFQQQDAALLGDCLEVMTMTAEKQPELILPYLSAIYQHREHKKTRVRWESAHALAYAAFLTPEFFDDKLEDLRQTYLKDKSIIVRDYTVDILANLAGTSEEMARKVYPFLVEAASAWEGRQARQALTGLLTIMQMLPEYYFEIKALAEDFTGHKKKIVQKVASTILKQD